MSDEGGTFFTRGRAISFVVLAAVLLAFSLLLPRDWNRLAVFAAVVITVPVVAVFAILASLLVGNVAERRAHRLRRERHEAGLCGGCGYDVRDIDEKCPECGMPIWRPRDPLTGKVLPAGTRNARAAPPRR